MVPLAALERLEAGGDRGAEVRAAARDDADVDRVEALAEGALVERERALDEGAAGERDETGAVALELRQQVLDGELRAAEAVRLHVGREHAARGVEGDDEIDALAMHLLPAKAPHGSSEREGEAEDRSANQHGTRRPPAPVDVGSDGRQQRCGDERRERALAPPPRPEEEGGERWHEQEGHEAHRVAPENHGSLRSTVSPSATSASTSASAGHTSQG